VFAPDHLGELTPPRSMLAVLDGTALHRGTIGTAVTIKIESLT
jgi:hypothetical protein